MGIGSSHICRTCGAQFMTRNGGGFYFDMLHCDTCSNERNVGHRELGDVHLGFVKGLPGPYALSRSAMDGRIQTYALGSSSPSRVGAESTAPA